MADSRINKAKRSLYTARWILPVTSPTIENGGVVVEGGSIVRVGSAVDILRDERVQERDLNTVELGNCVILPGLVNVHAHLDLAVLRGWCEEVDFFSWIRRLTAIKYECLGEGDFGVSARWGALEAIRNGITTVGNASDQEVVFDALLESGMRGIAYLEVFGPDPRDCDVRITAFEGKVRKLLSRQKVAREERGELISVGLSPHAPYTVSRPLFQKTMELAAAHSLPVSIHIAESQAESDFVLSGKGPFAESLRGRGIAVEARGMSPVRYLDEVGVLAGKPLLVHVLQLAAGDLDLIKARDAAIAHCPKSNAKLGHGIARLSEMLERGIRVGLGTDGTVSNNSCDLLEEARFACLQQRGRDDLPAGERSRLVASEILRLATLGGAEALGLADRIGSIEAGKRADFTAVDLSGPRHEPVNDPASAVVFSTSGADVVLTVVDGVPLFSDGRVHTLDEAGLTLQVDEINARVRRDCGST